MTPQLHIEKFTGGALDLIHGALVKGDRPFIVTDFATRWRAFSLWTLPYLAERIGDRVVKVGVSLTETFHYGAGDGPRTTTRMMSFREAVARCLHPRGASQERLYVMEQNADRVRSLPEVYPELAGDYATPPGLDVEQLLQTNLWVGGAGNTTPLHYDAANNFLAQIAGRKRLTLFGPAQSQYLYPNDIRRSLDNTSQLQTLSPDLERYPRFRHATALECVLQPGEMIYLPPFWWHHVESLDPAVSINFWWKPRLRQCLTPQGILMTFYLYDRGELATVTPERDSDLTSLARIGKYCLDRGHSCLALLFAKAEIEHRHADAPALVREAIAPWTGLLSQAETGDDTLLDAMQVAEILRSVEHS